MSMRSWTITGYGINESELNNVGTSDMIAFIKEFLPEEYGEMQADIQDYNADLTDTNEYINACEEWISNYEDISCNRGFAAIFADAVNSNENGFDVCYCAGEYEYENAILYEDRAPFEMSDRVKAMKKDDMKEIFAKYLKKLGIKEFKFERQSVEYFG